MTLQETLRGLIEREAPVACATIVAGPSGVGRKLLVRSNGSGEGDLEVAALTRQVIPDALRLLEEERSETRSYAVNGHAYDVFIDAFPAPHQIIVIGATHTAIALSTMASLLGYRTTVVDARGAFARADRFPSDTRVIKAWPQDVLPTLRLDRSTYVVLLSHDPKFDEPTLRIVLSSGVLYVGAIGSRKTQETRRERLRLEGFDEQALEKLYGPAGLDLGGRSAEEIALAIVAEITAVRYDARGAHLRDRLSERVVASA